MKIALAHFQWFNEFKGGAERYLEQAYDLLKDKVDLHLVTGYKKTEDGIPDNRYNCHYFSNSVLLKHLQYYVHTRNVLKKINPDIIHTMTLSTYVKKPFIFWSTQIDYTDSDFWLLNTPMYSQLAKRVFKKADVIQVHTECLKKQIFDKFDLPEEKIKLIEQPVDQNLRIDKDLRDKTRKELDVCDKTVVYFPARIIPNKRQDLLIKSLAHVKKNIRNDIVVMISGMIQDEEYFDYLKKLAHGLPVIFKPNVESICGLYNACDVVVHAREVTESGGSIIAEAMHLGKPLVLSDVDSFREVSKGNALFFKPGDVNDFAAKIEQIYNDAGTRNSLIREGFSIDKKFYSPSSYCKKQLEVYESVIKGNKIG